MIERSIVVQTDPTRAFHVWTERVGTWWPPAHHPSGDPAGLIQLESGLGGRFFERAADGRELEIGRVLHWEPPRRLRLSFFMGGGPATPSEVDVTFTPVDGGTRVHICHSAGALGDRFDAILDVFERNWKAVCTAFSAGVRT